MNIDTLTNHDLLQLMGGDPTDAEAQAMMDILKTDCAGKDTQDIDEAEWKWFMQRAIDAASPKYKEIVIRRTGKPPLKLQSMIRPGSDKAGWVGSTQTTNSTRWTEINIHKTKGGKYIAKIARVSQWENEDTEVTAQVCETPCDVIKFLQNDDGVLGSASQEAIESASKDLPEFRAAFVEVVE